MTTTMQLFKPYSLNVRGHLMTIHQPWVMAIVNVTPDSFYADSRANSQQELLQRVQQAVEQGADVIDVGACSTRPGSQSASEDEELARLQWALPLVRGVLPDHVLLSVDTFRATVAARCVQHWGADVVNDISGGTLDNQMFDTIARLRCPYVLTHTRGTPDTMQQHAHYDDVTADVLQWLARRLDDLRQRGVADVIVDPGFGFAKQTTHNYQLLRNLSMLHVLNAPLLVGVSRKRMVWQPLGITASDAVNGTTVLNTVALMAGAHILRVHDVREAVQARTLLHHLLHDNAPLTDY